MQQRKLIPIGTRVQVKRWTGEVLQGYVAERTECLAHIGDFYLIREGLPPAADKKRKKKTEDAVPPVIGMYSAEYMEILDEE